MSLHSSLWLPWFLTTFGSHDCSGLGSFSKTRWSCPVIVVPIDHYWKTPAQLVRNVGGGSQTKFIILWSYFLSLDTNQCEQRERCLDLAVRFSLILRRVFGSSSDRVWRPQPPFKHKSMDLDAFRAPLGAPEKILHFSRSLQHFYEGFRAIWNVFIVNCEN